MDSACSPGAALNVHVGLNSCDRGWLAGQFAYLARRLRCAARPPPPPTPAARQLPFTSWMAATGRAMGGRDLERKQLCVLAWDGRTDDSEDDGPSSLRMSGLSVTAQVRTPCRRNA
jgi:hypothetical protein